METPDRVSMDLTTPTRVSETATPTDDRLLRAEYEAYKLKTKDWQNKVRERDIKMRQQLQQSTDVIQAKDAEMDVLLKRVAALEGERDALRSAALHAQSAASQEEALEARIQQLQAELRARDDTIRSNEGEISQRVRDTQVLRSRVEQLESSLGTANARGSGAHVVFSDAAQTSVHSGLKITLRVAVPEVGKTYSYCQSSAGVAWVDEGLLSASLLREGPPYTLQQLMEEQNKEAANTLATAVANAESRLKAIVDQAISEERSAHSRELDAMEKRHQTERERVMVEQEEALRALQGQIETLRENEQRVLRQAVPQAIAKTTAQFEKTVAELRDQIRILEEYKSRAQLALKSTNPRPQESVPVTQSLTMDQAKQQMDEEIVKACAPLMEQLRLSEEARATEVGSQRETIRELEEELQSTRLRLQQESAELEAARTQLLLAARRHVICAGVQTMDVQDAAVGVHDGERSRRHAPLPDTSGVTTSSALETLRHKQHRREDSGECFTQPAASSSEFSFDAMLNSLHCGPQSSGTEGEATRLRQQLKQQQAVMQKLRDDLREVALREKTIMEQDAVIKEQLRDAERTISRSKDLVEHQDYTKNVIMKVLLCKDTHVLQMLLPVVGEVLHLSPEERSQLLASCARSS